MTTIAVIVAAGSGTRAGGGLPKQYQHIGGEAVLTHTIRALSASDLVDDIVVVINPAHRNLYNASTRGLNLLNPAMGGETRQQSAYNGLVSIAAKNPQKVLIHDAARPFVDAATIKAVCEAIAPGTCALPAIDVIDTIAIVDGETVCGRLARDELRALQTPQGFLFNDIFSAHQHARANGNTSASDDSTLMDKVVTVTGSIENIKLTTSRDMREADTKMSNAKLQDLSDIRVGQGFDVHAFEAGDHVILCGVTVPFDKKLKGHSDADVAMHALTDAILGALGEGDIGKHYPPSDPQWKGASSDIFLKGAIALVQQRGGMLANCDVTVICELPKLRPYIDEMCASLAAIMDCPVDRVSVKATTSEKLGFTGRGEGIAAQASATIRLPAGGDHD